MLNPNLQGGLLYVPYMEHLGSENVSCHTMTTIDQNMEKDVMRKDVSKHLKKAWERMCNEKRGCLTQPDGMEIWPQKINQNHENILAFGQHYQLNLQKNGVEKKSENNVGSRIFAPLGPSKKWRSGESQHGFWRRYF